MKISTASRNSALVFPQHSISVTTHLGKIHVNIIKNSLQEIDGMKRRKICVSTHTLDEVSTIT